MTCLEVYAGQDIAGSQGHTKVDGPNRRRQPASPRLCLAVQTNGSSSPTRGPLDKPHALVAIHWGVTGGAAFSVLRSRQLGIRRWES
jgi:hypothetical protein